MVSISLPPYLFNGRKVEIDDGVGTRFLIFASLFAEVAQLVRASDS